MLTVLNSTDHLRGLRERAVLTKTEDGSNDANKCGIAFWMAWLSVSVYSNRTHDGAGGTARALFNPAIRRWASLAGGYITARNAGTICPSRVTG
jgi:hypothetical protein